MFKDKGLIIGIVATVVLIGGGVFFFSRSSNSNTSSGTKISDNILIPQGAAETSGFENGSYLPATSSAKVTIVEFGDYQCPACAAYQSNVKQLLTDFAGKINYVFRDFAFIGTESTKASEAVYCAADQNKYWEFHEYLYSHQSGENEGAFSDANLKSFAAGLNLNSATFATCLNSDKYKDKVSNGVNDGNLSGVNSTPTFFLNGVKIDPIPSDYAGFKSLIDGTLSK